MRLILFIKIILIFLFSFSVKSYAQGGDNAAGAAASPITLPFSASGTTCGHVDNYNPLNASTGSTSGKDWLYYFCATTTGTVDIMVNNPNTTNVLIPSITAYSTTPNAGGTNYMSSSYDNAIPNLVNYVNGLLSINVTSGQCYYIMIDEDYTYSDLDCYAYNISIQYHVPPPAAVLQPACTNIGYDNGTFSGWIGTSGQVLLGAAGAPTPSYVPMYYNTTTSSQHLITSGAGLDPIGGFPIVNPSGGPNSFRLGDGSIGGAAGASLEQKFQVTASNALFVYYYAVVMQDGGSDHTNQEQPFFKTDVFDCSGNPVACGQYLVTGGPGIPGFILAGGTTYYKNWSPVAVDLTAYIGSCVTVRYTVGDCIKGAHFAYAYIDATCSPLDIIGINKVCPTKSTTLTAPVGLFTYSWTPGGMTTQSVVVTPTTTTTYTCQLTSFTNCQTFLTYSVSLFPAAIASINSQTVCNGTAALLTSTVNNGAGTYAWVPSGGAGPSASPSPTSTTVYTLTYTDSNNCQDTALGRVTVNPLPTMATPTNVNVCNNGNVPASAFSSTVAGTSYSWTNTNTSIGLAANGAGDTPGFIAINTGAAPVNAVISVTPTANTCVGPPVTYTILVNPTPNVNAVPSATYCAGVTVPSTNFTGSVAATTYSWANSNSSIGLGASGTGNIASYGATNASASGISGVITVTPTANTCVGTPTNFIVLVNPIPTVSAVPSATYCAGATVPATTFTGNVAGAIFNWTNSNTSIGAPVSGVATINSFNATNATSNPISGIITATPSANGCVGTPTNFTVLVNPIPNVSTVPSATYCAGATVPATNFTGSVTATTYDWTNTNTSIGLGNSGTGNIASYVSTNTSASGISGIITVTPSANACVGTPTNFTVLVNPIPNVNAIPSATYCAGATVPVTNFTGSVTSTTYNWANTNSAIGIGTSGTGNIASYVSTNTSASGISGVITVTPSANACVGTPTNFTVLVNPIPNVAAIPSATYCAGATVPSTNFTGSVTATTYDWTNTNTSIGLANSGTGNIASYAATNNGASGISGVITVTPSANACVGTPTNFTITVNPIPNVNVIPSATYCAGATVPATNFTGSVTATTYNWANTNSAIGLGTSGAGNIASYTSTNASSSGISGVITVTPSANSCVGVPTNFTVLVNPIPNVAAIPSATYCAGATVPSTNFTGSVTATTYDWTNSNSSIGLTNSGTGNIASYNATNASASGVITVTPSANACIGTPTNFTVLVNPIPTVNAIPSSTFCSGATVPATTFTGNISSTTYNWTNTNTTIGLGASGAGSITSFVSSNTGAASANGVVTVTPTASSCVGIPQSYTITVNPNPLAPTVANPTICPSSSATLTATAPGGTYNWFDNNVAGTLLGTNPTYITPALTITTTYYVNTTNAFGCVSPFTTVTANVLNVLAVSASPNQTICVGTNATLTVSPTAAGNTYTWDSPGNLAFSNVASSTVSPTVTTNYSVTVTNASGCTGTSQTQVIVNPLPIAYAGNPIAFCNGQSGTIGSAVISGYTYSWTPTTGLSNANGANPTVTLPNLGSTPSISNYSLTVMLNGCQSSNQVQVTVNPTPQSIAGSPVTLCSSQTGTLGTTNNSNYSYAWTPTANLSSSSSSNPTVSEINLGSSANITTYTVTTTEIATSCQSNNQVVVTVLPLPTVNAGPGASACEGATGLQLNGTIGGSVNSAMWSGGSGSFNTNNTVLNPTYNPSAADYLNSPLTLTLTGIATAPCQNVTSTVQIVFYKNPVVLFPSVPAGCPEHCVTFTDQSSVASPDFIQSWNWDFGDGSSGAAQNPYHCYTQSGLYSVTLTVTSNHLCSSTFSLANAVEVYPNPVASFYATPAVSDITDPNITFENTSQGAVSYIWGFGDSFANGTNNASTATNPLHEYTDAGTYVVTLIATSSHGCEDRTSTPVEIKPEFTFYIPNCFTPENSDGVNDVFTGMGVGIIKYEMWVFDRWGEKIFYTDDIYKGWNGKKLGHENVVQQDVYVWKVKLTDVFLKKHDYIGHVTLLK